MGTLTCNELAELKASHSDLRVIDVRLASVYAERHLHDALNNCVYEVAFGERMAQLVPDKDEPICVYGEAGSLESQTAAEKLERMSYTQVSVLEGGIESWIEKGLPTEIHDSAGPVETDTFPPEGERPIQVGASQVEWTGRNLASKHWGTLGLSSGYLEFREGELVGGMAVIDMHSIKNRDITDPEARKLLEEHLASDDFFNVTQYPEAIISLFNVIPLANVPTGTPNLHISARLTLKGVTETIEFLATAGIDGKGNWTAQASFDFDRTRFNVLYGSGRFFKKLGMHLVNDLINLQLKVVA